MPDGVAPPPFPSRRSLREAGGERRDSVTARDREVVTALPRRAAEERAAAPVRRQRRTFRRVVASACALSCALGLLATTVIPLLGGEAPAPQTSEELPSQQLAVADGFAVHDSFDALGSISAEVTGDPVDFINFTDAAIQFPFASGQALTDGFGPRSYPVAGFHDAQDFAAPAGTTVQAIARGKVVASGPNSDGCGFGVLLQHVIDGEKVTSRYCHMEWDSNDLVVGQSVDVGDPVGRVGATGLAFGAHLHFVLEIEGEAVDPMPFLTERNRRTRLP